MVSKAEAPTENSDLAIPRFSDADLLSIETYEDAAALLASTGEMPVDAAEVLGNGFEILATEDKASLINVPFFILEWRFNDGDQGEFVSCTLITKDNRKVVLNDGSTGIKDQLKFYTESTGRTRGLIVRRGLRVSEYTYTDSKGEERPAKTFYLNTSA